MAARGIDGFVEAADRALESGDRDTISEAELARVITLAVRLYAARAEATDSFPPPIEADKVTATAIVIMITEMMHAANLNMFDLNIWAGRARLRQ
jgi:hypothetical protein